MHYINRSGRIAGSGSDYEHLLAWRLTRVASKRRKGRADATADICIWDTTTGTCTKVLSYHPVAVQAIAFSPDGCWMASVGRDPERSAVIWDVLRGEAIAVGRTDKPLEAVAWRKGASAPQFVTVGGDGALLWTLEPTHLAQQALSVPQVRIATIMHAIRNRA